MPGDWNVAGVYVASFAVQLGLAFVVLLVLRRMLARVGFDRLVWNAPLMEAALYVCVLAVVASCL